MACPRLFIVDGTAMVYRAFFAFRQAGLATTTGIDTRALFGVTRFMLPFLHQHNVQRIVVVFDPITVRGASFRKRLVSAVRSQAQSVHALSLTALQQIQRDIYPISDKRAFPALRGPAPSQQPPPPLHDSSVQDGVSTTPNCGTSDWMEPCAAEASAGSPLRSLPDYKGHRLALDPELSASFAPVVELLDALGVCALETPAGWEADDLMATLATHAAAQHIPSTLVSNDKDFYQLLQTDVITLLQPTNNGLLVPKNEDWFFTEFGISPNRFVDVQGMVGDIADNIPGVPGIGIKTACKLVHKYGALESILHGVAVIEPARIARLLAQFGSVALLCKALASLDCTLRPQHGEEWDFDTFNFTGINVDATHELFTKLQFRKFDARAYATGGGLDDDFFSARVPTQS